MKKIKLICQIVVAFVIALFAYNIFYQPHSESVKARRGYYTCLRANPRAASRT